MRLGEIDKKFGVPREPEVWGPVRGWEATHEVSTRGRVRRVGGSRCLAQVPCCAQGYVQVGLCAGGVQRRRLVHRVVLEGFVGPCPPGMEGAHRDDDPTNNHLANLRWDTRKGNVRDRLRRGWGPVGAKKSLTPDQVRAVRADRRTLAVWAHELDVSRSTVRNARLGIGAYATTRR